MEIVPIFDSENKKEGLFAIHLDGEKEDEATKCINSWLFDTEYLHDFFTQHINDLNNGYYETTISIQEAIKFTRIEAEQLFQTLEELAITGANNGYENLSLAFQPLHDQDYKVSQLQQVKAKTKNQKKWLRIYAIKVSSNTFIVTGGAIKLVGSMQENEHLKKELEKLNNVKIFLKEEGIFDQEDFEDYILLV